MLFVPVLSILFFAVFGFFSLIYGLTGLSLRSLVRRVSTEGRMTEGQVSETRIRVSSEKYRQRSYSARIVYLVEGQSYEQSFRISQRHYELWTKGTRVQIHYLPSAPKLSLLPGDRTEQTMAIGYLVAAGVCVATAVGMVILTVMALVALRGGSS